MIRIRHAVAAAVLAASFFSSAAFAADSLYKRVGGYDALAAVTDDFIGKLATDNDFARFFVGFSEDSKKRIRQNIVDLFCQVTGGPCFYIGRDIKAAHAGLGITKAEWDKSVTLFVDTLNKFKVGEQEQKDLAALVVMDLRPATLLGQRPSETEIDSATRSAVRTFVRAYGRARPAADGPSGLAKINQ